MPQWFDPDRGWIATANNRPAPEDFPYPLSGTWSHGLRAERIRQMMEAKERFTREDFIAMQYDAVSVRAQRCLPYLLNVLKSNSQPRVAEAVRHLEQWDCRMEVDRVGATLFGEFFARVIRAARITAISSATGSKVGITICRSLQPARRRPHRQRCQRSDSIRRSDSWRRKSKSAPRCACWIA